MPHVKFPPQNLLTLATGAVFSALLLSGCNDDNTTTINETVSAVTVDEVITQNAKMAYAVYGDTVTTAQSLKDAIDIFVAKDAPNDVDLAELKTLWVSAREPYGLSEVWRFRFDEGPIDALKDDGTMGVAGDGPEGRINAWPLGEALIDYVATGTVDGDVGPENPNSASGVTGNIISDTSITIDKATLAGLNEAGDDGRNVATGYHAIEFLLWGQDLNEGVNSWMTPRDTSGGQRPVSDYNTNGGCTSGLNASGAPVAQADSVCQRRKDYLVAVTAILIDDLSRVKTAWDPAGDNNYYDTFTADGKRSLAKMLEAMGRLGFGELAGERMDIALRTDSQEDEHSCFSDNTHRDILTNAQGIVNTYIGTYTRVDGTVVDGPGIDDLLIASNATLDGQMQTALDNSMEKIRAIDAAVKAGNPFDNQIRSNAGGGNQADRDRVTAAILALVSQTDVIENVITALGVTAGDLRGDTDQPID